MRFRNILESDFYKKLPQQGAEVAKNAGKWVADNPLKSLTGVGAVALAQQMMTNQLTFGFVCPLSELSMIDRLKIRIQIIRYCSWFDFSREIERTDESGAGKTSDHLETVMRIKVSFEKCSFGTKVIVKEMALGAAILAKIKQSDVYEPFLLIDAMLPKDIIEKIKQAGKLNIALFGSNVNVENPILRLSKFGNRKLNFQKKISSQNLSNG